MDQTASSADSGFDLFGAAIALPGLYRRAVQIGLATGQLEAEQAGRALEALQVPGAVLSDATVGALLGVPERVVASLLRRARGDAADGEGVAEARTEVVTRPGVDLTEVATAPIPGVRSGGRTLPHRLGRYEVVAPIAEGGMGAVYRAVDTSLDRVVALKVLKDPAGGEEAIERLQREARLAGQLSHAGIITVHEVGAAVDSRTGEPVHFIAMDLVAGRTLAEGFPELTMRRRIEVLEQVCRAVGHAHGQGIIHRDLKPANVLLDAQGRAVVTDFGLARDTSDVNQLTLSGAVLGTVPYMAPEQVMGRGDLVDPRTDVWALGVMLYIMLTGSRPFRGDTAAEIYRQILEADPAYPRRQGHQVPRDLEAVCLRALEKDRRRRYADGTGMAEELAAWLAGRPVRAHPPSAFYRARKWARRHRALCLSVMAVSFAVLGTAGGLRWKRAGELARAEGAALAEVRSRRQRVDRRLVALGAVVTAQTPRLRQPNGQPDPLAVWVWLDAHDRAAFELEQLAGLPAPSARVRRALDRAWVNRQRLEICRRAWRAATSLGDYMLARSWVARARSAGFSAKAIAAANDRIERTRLARLARSLAQARALLRSARRPSATGLRGWFEQALRQLARNNTPELVRLLLQRAHLDSPHEWERRLAVEALGWLGDTRTRGEEGLDPVMALSARLARVDLTVDLESAVSLARALGALRDGRAYVLLSERRLEAGQYGRFWTRTAEAQSQLPAPPVEAGGQLRLTVAVIRGLVEDRKPTEALGVCDRAVAAHPRVAELYRIRGGLRQSLGRLDGALEDFQRVLELGDALATDHGNLGNVRLALGDVAGARADMDRQLELAPEGWVGWFNRAVLRSRAGDPRGALADFDKAISLRRDNPRALVARAELHIRQGRPGAALTDLERAIRAGPGFAHAYKVRSVVHKQAGRLPEALADLARAIRLETRDKMAYLNRGEVYAQMGEWGRALADFDRALALDPKLALAHHDRALVLERLGRPREALAAHDRAVTLLPSVRHLSRRAMLHFRAERWAAALGDFEKVLALDPTLWDTWGSAGVAAARAGRAEKARRLLTEARRRAPADRRQVFDRLLRQLGQ